MAGLLDDSIEKSVAALIEAQRDDGSWPGDNFAGPMYTGMTLVVEKFVGELNSHDASEAIRWISTTQFEDGSFPSYPFAKGGDPSATGMVYAGLIAAGAETLAPELLERTKRYLDLQGGLDGLDPQTRMYLALAGAIDPSTLDRPTLFFKLIPGIDRMLGSRFGLAMVLIANQNSMIVRGLQSGTRRSNPWRHPIKALENRRVLEYLDSHQNPEGNWAGVIMPTLAGILCLHFLGLPHDDPRFRNAVEYLRKWKQYDDEGLRVMPTIGVIWNTAEVTKALMLSRHHNCDESIAAGLDYLLKQQSDKLMPADWQNPDPGQPRSGGWNYYSDNKLCCDADTTGAVLWTLGLALNNGMLRSEESRVAAQRGLRWELGMQNKDGGWPAFAHGHTSKPPGPMYVKPLVFPKAGLTTMIKLFLNPPPALADPATEGLTGRVLSGLAQMGHDTNSEPVRSAIAFLKQQQWTNGGWWGRWEVNFLLASGCVLNGLKAVGEDMSAAYVRTAVEWMLSCQNGDGGWGESLDSYSNPETAGRGPSSSIITGGVVSALIDCGEAGSKAVKRGVEYIISQQKDDGFWEETQCYYVILPPVYYYTNFFYSQYLPLEALIKYRETL